MPKFNLKKGYNLNLEGKPIDEIIEVSSPDIIKVDPNHYKYIKPKLLVKVGDSVKVGSPLFYDKNNPDINHASPCSGKIKNIEYGERRKILGVDIENDKEYSVSRGVYGQKMNVRSYYSINLLHDVSKRISKYDSKYKRVYG